MGGTSFANPTTYADAPSRGPTLLCAVATGAWALLSWAVLSGSATSTPVCLVALAIVFAASAAAAAWSAWRQRSLAWLLLALAIAVYSFSSFAYTVEPGLAERFPSVFDAGLWTFYPLMAAVVVIRVRTMADAHPRRLWLDASAFVLAMLAFAFRDEEEIEIPTDQIARFEQANQAEIAV